MAASTEVGSAAACSKLRYAIEAVRLVHEIVSGGSLQVLYAILEFCHLTAERGDPVGVCRTAARRRGAGRTERDARLVRERRIDANILVM